MNYPKEFTPEMNSDYLSNILGPLGEQGEADEGRARREANDRGLSGQAMEGSLVGLARQGAARNKASALSDFNFKVAGLARDERLTHEKEAYDSAEAQKDRDFRERLTSMGYQHEVGMLGAEQGYNRVQGQQGLVAGGAMRLGTNIAGSWLSRPGS